MKLFNERELRYFESLCGEKMLVVRQEHEARTSEIDRTVTAPNRFSRHRHEQAQYAKELIDARIKAFMETCQKLSTFS